MEGVGVKSGRGDEWKVVGALSPQIMEGTRRIDLEGNGVV